MKSDPDLTAAQRAFWQGMTDQRVANMWDAADFIHDLSAEGKEFLLRADPATLNFLKQMREDEVKDFASSIKYYVAFRTAGSFLFWGIGALLGAFIAVMSAWDRVSVMVKGAKS